MKHWETGNGSLPLTLAALTTHSNFPSFSFSKQTVAAASLALHAVVLHTLVHKVHQDVQGTAAWEDLSKLQNGEEAGKHHCMGRRERQSPQSPGGKSVPEQSHSEHRVLPKAGHTGQWCTVQQGAVCWACAPSTAMWHSGYILALQTSLLPASACKPFFSQVSSVQVLRELNWRKEKKNTENYLFFCI